MSVTDKSVPRPNLAGDLRLAITRLARMMRQHDGSDLGPTLNATLATIASFGPLTLGELAQREHVQPPTISRAVDKLERLGFVERVRDRRDRRVARVLVTPAGSEHVDTMYLRRTAWLDERIHELSATDIAGLESTLHLLRELVRAPDNDSAENTDLSTDTER